MRLQHNSLWLRRSRLFVFSVFFLRFKSGESPQCCDLLVLWQFCYKHIHMFCVSWLCYEDITLTKLAMVDIKKLTRQKQSKSRGKHERTWQKPYRDLCGSWWPERLQALVFWGLVNLDGPLAMGSTAESKKQRQNCLGTEALAYAKGRNMRKSRSLFLYGWGEVRIGICLNNVYATSEIRATVSLRLTKKFIVVQASCTLSILKDSYQIYWCIFRGHSFTSHDHHHSHSRP